MVLPVSIIWYLDDDPEGNVQHIDPADVDRILQRPSAVTKSRSSGRPITFGYLTDGRYIAVVYERISDDPLTLYPVTAYEAPKPSHPKRSR